MEAKQIELLKKSHMAPTVDSNGNTVTAGGYVRFCLDGGIDLVTSKEFVEFDDANNLMHCVCMNEDYRSQCDYPIKVISADYGVVQQVESIYSQKNFENFLKTGFLSTLSKEKKEKLIEWSHSIRNQALKIDKPKPYYKNMPQSNQSGTEVAPRFDGIVYSSSYDAPTVRTAKDLATANKLIEKSKPGDTIVVDKSVVFPEHTVIKCDDLTLISDGAPFTSTLRVDGNNVTLKGFVLSGKNDLTKPFPDNTSMVVVTGDNFNMTDCVIAPNGSYYSSIYLEANDVSINNCVFKDSKNKITVGIEFANSKDKKIISANISNNKFCKGSCKEDAICITQLDDNALVYVFNNVWEYSNAAIRISNKFNSKNVVIDCSKNKYNEINKDNPAFLVAKAINGEDFKNVTIRFRNLIGPGNKPYMANGKGPDRIMYTVGTDTEPVTIFSH